VLSLYCIWRRNYDTQSKYSKYIVLLPSIFKKVSVPECIITSKRDNLMRWFRNLLVVWRNLVFNLPEVPPILEDTMHSFAIIEN
jgi:hypothetical protein